MDYEGIQFFEQMKKWKYFLYKIVILKKKVLNFLHQRIKKKYNIQNSKRNWGGEGHFGYCPENLYQFASLQDRW